MATPSNLPPNIRHEQRPPLQRMDPSVSAVLDSSIQAHLGQHLRTCYGDPAEDKLPPNLARLLDRVAQVVRARTDPVDQVFLNGILASVTSLRAFAISLARDALQAEDLVQETVLRAISKREQFVAGTNLQAWLFTILRNQFCSDRRKALREVEDADGSYAATMIALADQEDRIMIHDLEAALHRLPEGQREAILLVGADGLSYEEAAQVLGCAVGTVKSRVNRARNCLAEFMRLAGEDGLPDRILQNPKSTQVQEMLGMRNDIRASTGVDDKRAATARRTGTTNSSGGGDRRSIERGAVPSR